MCEADPVKKLSWIVAAALIGALVYGLFRKFAQRPKPTLPTKPTLQAKPTLPEQPSA